VDLGQDLCPASYFTESYADGSDFDENKFSRFKTLDDLVAGN